MALVPFDDPLEPSPSSIAAHLTPMLLVRGSAGTTRSHSPGSARVLQLVNRLRQPESIRAKKCQPLVQYLPNQKPQTDSSKSIER